VVLVPALLTLAGRAHRTGHRVAAAQAVLLDLRHRDVDIVGTGEEAAGAHEGVVVEHVDDAGHRQEHVVLGDLRLAAALTTLAATSPSVAEPAAPTPSPALGLLLLTLLRAAFGTVFGALLAFAVPPARGAFIHTPLLTGLLALLTGLLALLAGLLPLVTGLLPLVANLLALHTGLLPLAADLLALLTRLLPRLGGTGR